MRVIRQLFLLVALAAASSLAAAYDELGREPRGPDLLVPTAGAPQPSSPSGKIIIYTAKTIVTLDPGTPTAQAVAVMDGKILGAGTLDEVRGWITNQGFEIDRRFQDAVIVPGFIEPHMHPQFAGVLWQGAYIGRLDRISPDGVRVTGLATKRAVIERLREAAAKLPDNGKWLIAWGYQPEFYDNAPLTRADLDPISNGHPMFIENLSMHIYYANSKAFEIAGIPDNTGIVGIVKQDGEPTGEIKEIPAALTFFAKLPLLDGKVLLKATWDAAKLAHRTGVTTFADLSFGFIPGGYKAYQAAAADPDFPVRIVLNPLINIFQTGEIADKGGLDYLAELHKADNDRLRRRQHVAGKFEQVDSRGAQAWIPSGVAHQRQLGDRNGARGAERGAAAISARRNPASAGAQSVRHTIPADPDESAWPRHRLLHQPHLLLG
jgi:hypothetical protein